MEIFNEMLFALLGAFLALFGGFLQKRFDMYLDREETDVNILSEILILTTIFLKAKLQQQVGSGVGSENVLDINRKMATLVFRMRSRKYQTIKKQIIKFISKSLNNFQFTEMENLQKNIEDVLTIN